MTDLQAAILEVQLGRLDHQHEIRAANARRLRTAVDDIDGLTNLRIDDRVTTQAIYQFVFRFDSEAFASIDRDTFVAALAAEGVPADGRFYESLPVSELLRPDPARYPAWSEALARRPAADWPQRRARRLPGVRLAAPPTPAGHRGRRRRHRQSGAQGTARCRRPGWSDERRSQAVAAGPVGPSTLDDEEEIEVALIMRVAGIRREALAPNKARARVGGPEDTLVQSASG